MIFAHLSRLLSQAEKSGEPNAPLPASAFAVPFSARCSLVFAGTPFTLAMIVMCVAPSVVSMAGLFQLASLCEPLGLNPLVSLTIFALSLLIPAALAALLLPRMNHVLPDRWRWLDLSAQENMALCKPLSEQQRTILMSLVANVHGGAAYHQRILDSGRDAYGFDLELLRRVHVFQQHGGQPAVLDENPHVDDLFVAS